MSAITLTARCGYNARFAPEGAKKPYIAELEGLTHDALTFDRNFRTQSTIVSRPGLFEVQHVDKKGRADREYVAVVLVGGVLTASYPTTAERAVEILTIAGASSRPIEDVVRLVKDADGDLVVTVVTNADQSADPIDPILVAVAGLSAADRDRLIAKLLQN